MQLMKTTGSPLEALGVKRNLLRSCMYTICRGMPSKASNRSTQKKQVDMTHNRAPVEGQFNLGFWLCLLGGGRGREMWQGRRKREGREKERRPFNRIWC